MRRKKSFFENGSPDRPLKALECSKVSFKCLFLVAVVLVLRHVEHVDNFIFWSCKW